jgi:hypothetical protein
LVHTHLYTHIQRKRKGGKREKKKEKKQELQLAATADYVRLYIERFLSCIKINQD